MIKQLILTTMLTTGVATATPFTHVADTHDYEEQISIQTGTSTSTTINNVNDVPEGNIYESFNNNATSNNEKWNINLQSNYLNINGNVYVNKLTKAVNITFPDQGVTYLDNLVYMANYDRYSNNLNALPVETSRLLYVMQITPYNYNVNTEAEITLNLGLKDWYDATIYQGDFMRFHTTRISYVKNVYTSTDQSWAKYLNQQTRNWQAYEIARDIENPENSFYFTKNQELNSLNYDEEEGEFEQEIIDTTIFSMTPETINYLVIEITPLIQQEQIPWYNAQPQGSIPVDWKNTLQRCTFAIDSGGRTNKIKISGTNVTYTGRYEVIDLPGLMWEILSMPFAFVSQAFNLTLFPGTPYQLNIANLFLSLLAIFVFVWLLGLFIKHK